MPYILYHIDTIPCHNIHFLSLDMPLIEYHFDAYVHERRNSVANAPELLRLSCTNPLISFAIVHFILFNIIQFHSYHLTPYHSSDSMPVIWYHLISESSSDTIPFTPFIADHTICLYSLWPPGKSGCDLKFQFSFLFYWLASWNFLMIISSDECHGFTLMRSWDWFR